MRRNLSIFSLFFLLFFDSHAGCLDGFKKIIRNHIEKRNKEKIEYIILKQKEKRLTPFKRKVLAITVSPQPRNYFRSTKRFLEFISKENIPENIRIHREIAKTLWRSLKEGSEIIEWTRKLQRELYTDAFFNSPFSQRLLLKMEGLISKSTVRRIMRKKYIETELFEEFQTIDRTLTEENFGHLLLTKKLILDKTFAGKQHGELIHLLQVDMMFHILGRNGFSNQQILDFYRWMGLSSRISGIDGQRLITPLSDVWVTLFDSFEKNLGRPETFNPLLMSALGLN
tara:strand:+ start:6123 stop:6974 length:852 start_codon:yes stop_codon:yes gene_type:complete